MILETFLLSFAIIFTNEIGDKSHFFTMSSLLAFRKHPLALFFGGSLALIFSSALAVGLAYMVPTSWTPSLEKFFGAVLCIFAVVMFFRALFFERERDCEKEVTAPIPAVVVFATQAAIIFGMEFGDKTQAGIVGLVLKYQTEWLSILLGACLAFVLIQAVSIWVMRFIHERYLKIVQIVGLVMLFLFGIALGGFS